MVVLNCSLLKEAIDNGAKLIDVREASEFSRGKLPYAINVPLSKLAQSIHDHVSHEDEVLLYCHSGGRSGAAAEAMLNAGFANVKNVGGIIHYNCHE